MAQRYRRCGEGASSVQTIVGTPGGVWIKAPIASASGGGTVLKADDTARRPPYGAGAMLVNPYKENR
jgi:hypothetical protein